MPVTGQHGSIFDPVEVTVAGHDQVFIADVQARFSTHALQAQQSQTRHHNALMALYGDRLSVW
ncbi:hypothetical protein C2W62_28775 [Candidatus Entotheonella serta]|nr:hypothetical protein C2W62_28775 [Candidatus Entotheonella serta]